MPCGFCGMAAWTSERCPCATKIPGCRLYFSPSQHNISSIWLRRGSGGGFSGRQATGLFSYGLERCDQALCPVTGIERGHSPWFHYERCGHAVLVAGRQVPGLFRRWEIENTESRHPKRSGPGRCLENLLYARRVRGIRRGVESKRDHSLYTAWLYGSALRNLRLRRKTEAGHKARKWRTLAKCARLPF